MRLFGRSTSRVTFRLGAALVLVAVATGPTVDARAEQASQPSSAGAGQIDAGGDHTCALVAATVRCWGLGFTGQLGYGDTESIGDDERPLLDPVQLGAARTPTAISAGDFHTCALLDDGTVRCWGFGDDGRLGYGNENEIGDDESPGSVGPVNLGPGSRARAISAGGAHTCALLDDGTVRCWGFGGDGRLGYGDTNTIGDDETPGSIEPVSLGGRATAISAGGSHTCALLEDGSVRCWGTNGTLFGGDGRLGYGNGNTIGDNETPDSVDPVNVGTGRTATAISAADVHTCALLNGGDVRCWGLALNGRLGYVTQQRAVGDNEAPAAFGPVAVGRSASAISAGRDHTCARLDNGTVRCWGRGADGRLGYATSNNVGDDETPDRAGPVNLGPDRTATAISAGGTHTCGQLDDATVRCWGSGLYGRLGYGNQNAIGDDEPPGAAGPVDFRLPASIDDATVSEGDSGEVAVTFKVTLAKATGVETSVAYATADGSARAPEDYTAGSGSLVFAPGETSRTLTVIVKGDTLDEPNEGLLVNLSGSSTVTPEDPQATGTILDDDDVAAPGPAPVEPGSPAYWPDHAALRTQTFRLRRLRSCLAEANRHAARETGRARRLTGSRREAAKRHARRHKRKLRRACSSRWGRTPGQVTGLEARAVSPTTIVLSFRAPGTDGSRPPAARAYLVKQSLRPIRDARAFRRAQALCDSSCRITPTFARVGSATTLRVTDLEPRTTYYYSVAARDNVSSRVGPRSPEANARTR